MPLGYGNPRKIEFTLDLHRNNTQLINGGGNSPSQKSQNQNNLRKTHTLKEYQREHKSISHVNNQLLSPHKGAGDSSIIGSHFCEQSQWLHQNIGEVSEQYCSSSGVQFLPKTTINTNINRPNSSHHGLLLLDNNSPLSSIESRDYDEDDDRYSLCTSDEEEFLIEEEILDQVNELNPNYQEQEEQKLDKLMQISEKLFFAGMTPQHKLKHTLSLLSKGIKGRKFHYSKKQSKDCFISLTNDKATLYWNYGETPLPSAMFTKSKFKISNIQQIIYGPYTYTFRAYRLEQLLALTQSSQTQLFLGWECVSFKLQNRTVDFIINDQHLLMDFLFAMWYLLKLQRIKEKENAKVKLLKDKQDEQRIVRINMGQIAAYKLVRIKLKISYEAAKKRMTILELFINAMIKAYNKIHGLEEQVMLSDDEFDEAVGINEDVREQNNLSVSQILSKKKNSIHKAPKPQWIHEKLMKLIANHSPFAEHLKGLQKLQGMRVKLQYNRRKFESHLRVRANFNQNLSEQLPNEMKIWRLPISYHYYDAVPVIMAINLINHHSAHLEMKELDNQSTAIMPGDVIYNKTLMESENAAHQRAHRETQGGFLGFVTQCFQAFGRGEPQLTETQQKEKKLKELARDNKLKEALQTIDMQTLKNTKMIQILMNQLKFLQYQDNQNYDLKKLVNKQLHLKQLMQLKTKGRFLLETALFEGSVNKQPSTDSQRKVIHSLQLQQEDQFDDAVNEIKSADTLVKKHKLVKDRIYKEYFYYNPVYDSLVRKRQLLVEKDPESKESQHFFTSFPSLQPKVRYKKKRKRAKQSGLLALTKVDFVL
ncbi:hypothetical protein FGO68_gene10014 [Halteria grandinella]|uniref:Uncharacterized protein n=1 Tax=Halteria grandinella TaxID=5974 RepID=A0A8J8SXT9_HALGN|nr:hypothetical protein FGO68_gene10014 [Halteria grandinella]